MDKRKIKIYLYATLNNKRLPIFIFLFIAWISCESPSNDELILGQWEIISWRSTTSNTDLLKSENAALYSVRFEKDTVYILESVKGERHDYKFLWKINADSLEIKSLGNFRIQRLDQQKCVLETKQSNLFRSDGKIDTERLTLLKK